MDHPGHRYCHIWRPRVAPSSLTRQLRSESGASALERMALLSELKLSTHGHAGSPLHSLLASRLVGAQKRACRWSLRASECQAWFDAANRGLRTIVQMLVLGEGALLVIDQQYQPARSWQYPFDSAEA